MRKMIGLVVMALGAASLTACGGADCKSLCGDSNACEGAEEMDCAVLCDTGSALSDTADCTDKFDAMIDCIDAVEDICAEDVCTTESNDWGTCIATYCAENADNEDCTKLFAEMGGGA